MNNTMENYMRKRIHNILIEADNSIKRFRPSSYHAFADPITGEDGSKIIGYEWEYEWIETVDKRGEEIQVRISNWERAEYNERTGRMIVHLFHVLLPDGKEVITSAEEASKMVGVDIRSIRNSVNKQMKAEEREHKKNQTKQDIINGTAQLTFPQAKKEWSKLTTEEKTELYLKYLDRHPEFVKKNINDKDLYIAMKSEESKHTFSSIIDFRQNFLSYINSAKEKVEIYGYAKDKGGANGLFWSRFQTPPRKTYSFKGKDIPLIDESYFMHHQDGRIMRVHEVFDKYQIPFFEYIGFKRMS